MESVSRGKTGIGSAVRNGFTARRWYKTVQPHTPPATPPSLRTPATQRDPNSSGLRSKNESLPKSHNNGGWQRPSQLELPRRGAAVRMGPAQQRLQQHLLRFVHLQLGNEIFRFLRILVYLVIYDSG